MQGRVRRVLYGKSHQKSHFNVDTGWPLRGSGVSELNFRDKTKPFTRNVCSDSVSSRFRYLLGVEKCWCFERQPIGSISSHRLGKVSPRSFPEIIYRGRNKGSGWTRESGKNRAYHSRGRCPSLFILRVLCSLALASSIPQQPTNLKNSRDFDPVCTIRTRHEGL